MQQMGVVDNLSLHILCDLLAPGDELDGYLFNGPEQFHEPHADMHHLTNSLLLQLACWLDSHLVSSKSVKR